MLLSTQIPVPVSETPLSLWLQFATPVTVAAFGSLTAYFLARQSRKINDIHIFTNSALGQAYRTTAIALRLLANHTSLPADIAAAARAEEISASHDATQREIDRIKGGD
jgi:hypothetical protein